MKVWKNEQGVISIFLIIIFLALLMLAGLLIDLSRIMAAERKVQNALDTATRSIAANYDQELVGQFGLYGITQSSKLDEELKRYFTTNLVDRHENFHLITYNIDEVKLHYQIQEGLLNDEVFKKQICEYMKYKGPILVTENVIETFKQGSFDGKADLMETSQNSQKSMDQIGEKKITINNIAKNICASAMEEIGDTASEMSKDLNSIENEIRVLEQSLSEAEKELKEANRKADEIREKTEETFKKYGETMEADQDITKLAGEDDLAKLKGQLIQIKVDIRYNEEILTQIQPLEERYRQLVEREEELDSEKTLLKSLLSKISDAQKAELEAIEAEMAEIAVEKADLEKQIQALYQQLKALTKLEFPENGGIEQSLEKSATKSKEGLLNKLKGLLDKELPQDSCIKEEDFAAGAAGGVVGQSSEHVDISNPEEQLQKMGKDTDKAEEVSDGIFSFMEQISKTLADIAQGGMERVYITEYIMDKYTFVTSPIERAHFFDQGEVEYIICGSNSQIANLVGTFARVWGIRFAVNAVDYFFTCKLPTFWSRLGYALLQGFTKATQDMEKMYNGTGIALSPSLEKLPGRLSYSDHLRLLLLLNSEKTNLKRMRQLIQVDLRQIKPNFELKNHGTVIVTEAEVSINLWFSSLLNLDKLGVKQIKGNKYYIRKTALVEY